MKFDQQCAFEYVIGSMRGAERETFELRLAEDATLMKAVAYWEEQMMAFKPAEETPPKQETWNVIAEAVEASRGRVAEPTAGASVFAKVWQWLTPALAVAFCAVVMIGYSSRSEVATPDLPGYVAVLTSATGEALLTALTSSGKDNVMTLQWGVAKFSDDANAQLWAVSRRDGQVRSLAVLDQPVASLQLAQAAWRLVTDAEYLVLTEEEAGGSATDEPSGLLLAKGICVRLGKRDTLMQSSPG